MRRVDLNLKEDELPHKPPQGPAHRKLSIIEASAGEASVWAGLSLVSVTIISGFSEFISGPLQGGNG